MKARFCLVLATVLASTLAGCALPTYRAPLGVALTDVKLSPNMRSDPMTLCTQGACFTGRPVNGHLKVPVGQRVTLYRNFVASGYQVTYSCFPGMSFVPAAGLKYYADFEIRDDRCGFFVFRIKPDSRIGIALDETARAIKAN